MPSGAPFAHPLLGALSGPTRRDLASELTPFALNAGDVLFDAGEELDRVWFVLRGLVSLSSVFEDGTEVDGHTVGRGAAVGLPSSLGSRLAFHRATVQVEGAAWTLPGRSCAAAMAADPVFNSRMMLYYEAVYASVARASACNGAHSLRQRFCRWILVCRHQLGADELPVRQDLLTRMLGVNRTTVAPISRSLQQEGVISVRHGRILIEDVGRLEQASCECYGAMRVRFDRMSTPHPDPAGAP
ncbi:MAG: Crp/Fnr family transcriptional regulator [Hansschlegelia sp.]